MCLFDCFRSKSSDAKPANPKSSLIEKDSSPSLCGRVKTCCTTCGDNFCRRGRRMGIILGLFNPELSNFQKKKLTHEFRTFFDLNKDGTLEWKDFDLARQKICEMSGWETGTEKFIKTHETFVAIWRKVQDTCDIDQDGKVTEEEWLKMWQEYHKQCLKASKERVPDPEAVVPEWLEKYIEYKFNLYDRTGDGRIDVDEFEYVLSDFGVPSREAKNAFLMITENNEKVVDMDYFKELCTQYFRSDDPSALGNFITGKIQFTE
ncbi:hypothetical protein ScPMuIL_003286 [Solemya velum]